LKDVVIGSSVESMFYAFTNDYFHILSSSNIPIFYKECCLNLFGNPRQDYTWSRLFLLLSLQGQMIDNADLQNIRLQERKLKIITSSHNQEYEFNNCHIFEPAPIVFDLDIEVLKSENPVYIVYDDFELSNLGGRHTFLPPKISISNFAKEIHFYSSSRVDGSKYITDCVAESHLSYEDLMDFDYSDTMARFAVERYLDSIDIKGNKIGLYKNGSNKYRKPRVLHNKRVVIKKDNNLYKDTKNVFFIKNFCLKDAIS